MQRKPCGKSGRGMAVVALLSLTVMLVLLRVPPPICWAGLQLFAAPTHTMLPPVSPGSAFINASKLDLTMNREGYTHNQRVESLYTVGNSRWLRPQDDNLQSAPTAAQDK
jgi:hypothetical protein